MCKEVYTIFRQRRAQRKHTQPAKGKLEMTNAFFKSIYLEFYTGRAEYLTLKLLSLLYLVHTTFSFIFAW